MSLEATLVGPVPDAWAYRSHELVQDLHQLVDVSAGLRYEICVHFEDQVVETGAVAAKEHQSVVEGL
jgi:hypothetical protein